MKTFEIKTRSGVVLYACGAATLAEAVEKAAKVRANLTGAYLAGADLAGANLAGADLSDADLADADLADAYLSDANLADADLADADLADAYLSDANLTRANLTRAYLTGAYLADANLAGANLAGADLADAYLSDANLTRAYLSDADLAGANLAGADLTRAYLSDADLAGWERDPSTGRARRKGHGSSVGTAVPMTRETFEERRLARQKMTRQERAAQFRADNPSVPFVPGLDRRILDVLARGGALEMGRWHTCATTHCRAGWATHLAGAAGQALEDEVGPFRAGRAIYLASTGRAPHFFASNEAALEDIRRCAAEQDV